MERSESQARRQNVIIRGLELNGRDLKREVDEFLKGKLSVNEEIKKVIRLGNNLNNNNNSTGVLVQVESLEAKRKIMRNKTQLKGIKIFIDDDLTKREREIYKTI